MMAAISLVMVVLALAFWRYKGSVALDGQPEKRRFQGALIESSAASSPAAFPLTASSSDRSATLSNAPAASDLAQVAPLNSPNAEPAGLSEDEVVTVGFDRLSAFTYVLPDEDAPEAAGGVLRQVPEAVRALHNRRVALKGFMLPLRLENGLATQLLMLRDQSLCCFGAVPRLNEWVNVTMRGKGVRPVMDQPITLFGRLQVAEVRENGFLVGIYAMEGEEVAGPLDL